MERMPMFRASITNFTLMLGCVFAPMIIARIGSKLTMAIGSLAFTAFHLAFQSFNRYAIFAVALFQGFGAGCEFLN